LPAELERAGHIAASRNTSARIGREPHMMKRRRVQVKRQAGAPGSGLRRPYSVSARLPLLVHD
jgi:hypothetical protein